MLSSTYYQEFYTILAIFIMNSIVIMPAGPYIYSSLSIFGDGFKTMKGKYIFRRTMVALFFWFLPLVPVQINVILILTQKLMLCYMFRVSSGVGLSFLIICIILLNPHYKVENRRRKYLVTIT